MKRGRTWLRDASLEDLDWIATSGMVGSFWERVDSDPGPNRSHGGVCLEAENVPPFGDVFMCQDWTHVRGAGCLAATSSFEKCNRAPLEGVPFCDFHFGAAWESMLAFVNQARADEMDRIVEFDRDAAYRRSGVDLAMVRDAKRALERSPERVYFYAVGEYVKIGRSINVAQRIKTLSGTKAPEGIDVRSGHLIGTIPGGSAVELSLHGEFGEHRVAGEWFALEPISSRIDALICDSGEQVAA